MATKNQTLSVMLDGSGNVKSAHNPAMGLSDLSDIDTTGLANDKTLKYNSSTSKWEVGDLTIDNSNLISVASVDSAFTALVGTAPAELDTLSEISTRLGDDPTFGTGWASYQGRQKTKTWTGMTGKGPSGASLPIGQGGSTVQLTNGVNGNGDAVGIPVEADLRYANVEVFLNGVLMKNAYRSATDGTIQWASGEFDYHPHDGTVSAGSTNWVDMVAPDDDLYQPTNFNQTTIEIQDGIPLVMTISFYQYGDDIMGNLDQNSIDALLTGLGIDPSNPNASIGSQISWVNHTQQGSGGMGGGTSYSHQPWSDPVFGTPFQDSSYYWTGTISGISTMSEYSGYSNDVITFSSIVDSNGVSRNFQEWIDWWTNDNGNDFYVQEGITRVHFFTQSAGGPTIWNGSGSQPNMNYIVFPNIDFVADDVLTIRTF